VEIGARKIAIAAALGGAGVSDHASAKNEIRVSPPTSPAVLWRRGRSQARIHREGNSGMAHRGKSSIGRIFNFAKSTGMMRLTWSA